MDNEKCFRLLLDNPKKRKTNRFWNKILPYNSLVGIFQQNANLLTEVQNLHDFRYFEEK